MKTSFLPARPNFVMRRFAGTMAFAVAAALAFLELIALIDPAGTKMADDAAPFGDSQIAWYEHAAVILTTVALFIVGCWLRRTRVEK